MSPKLEEWMERAAAGAKPTKGRKPAAKTAIPSGIDVAAIRRRTGMGQAQFAASFGFSLSGLKKLESGERKPSKAIIVLLRTIDYSAGTVIRANSL